MDSQRIAEHLAGELDCSVLFTDRRGRVTAASYAVRDHGALWEAPSATALATGAGGLSDAELLRAAHVARGDDGSPLRRWLTVPLLASGERLGWGLIGQRLAPLDARDLSLIDIAAELLATTGEYSIDGTASRRAVFSATLDADPDVRRGALRKAITRRWLKPREPALIHALVLDDALGLLERLRVAHLLCRAIPATSEVLRAREDAVFILSCGMLPSAHVNALIRVAAAEGGHALVAVGSASVCAEDQDLARPAHAAATAAELSLAIPELAEIADADGLGGWALLHAVRGHRSLLRIASPAAEALCAAGEVHRLTVETYLDAAGQVPEACERLHIARTTLYYRLENLPDVVKGALGDGMQRSTLHLALKLDRLWAAAGVA